MTTSVLSTRKIINRNTTAAINIVDSFIRNNSTSVFPSIKASRLIIANDLKQRIKDISKINQAEASLCGPAAFMHCIAKDAPAVYAQYVIDLYTKGKGEIGGLTVKPSKDCLNAKIPRSTSRYQITAVDWIALASLRDSSNAMLDYKSPSNQTADITLPSMMTIWFKTAGYGSVTNDTNLYFDKNLNLLSKTQNLYNGGHNVCLFISAKVSNLPSTLSILPNHWVVLTDSIKEGGTILYPSDIKQAKDKKLNIEVYSWGSVNNIVNTKLTAYEFTDYFFGYVSSK